MHRLFIGSILFILLFSCGKNQRHSYQLINYDGIKGQVFDFETGLGLPARIAIRDSAGKVVDTYYDHEPGFFTDENGSFAKELPAGKYTIEVFHGIEYLSFDLPIEIPENQGIDMKIYLKPWFNIRKLGWVNGDGHCHLYTEKKPDTAMAALVRKICLAQGVDFVCAAQGWAGYNDSTWEEGYQQFTDDKFILHYGSEMPKFRTGHTWWLGQRSTLGYYWQSMDSTYENQYYQSFDRTHCDFEDLEFSNIPDFEIVQRLKLRDSSIAVMPHPTSWWMQQRGEIEKYTTNVSSHLAFGLLAGKIWDGIVVMGYNHDHIFYQNLWFNILNQGYRMPALGELDGGFNKNSRFYYGSMRTYYKLEDEFTIPNVADAVRNGRTFVTSGPIIQANIDDKYEIGDVLEADGAKHQLNLHVLASGEAEDYLSFVIIYRNAEVFNYWDLRDEQFREFVETIEISESEPAWYVIKAYGAKAVEDPRFLDILALCKKKEGVKIPDFSGANHDVCITSPFYFRHAGMMDPDPLVAQVDLQLIDPSSGRNIELAEIEIIVNGRTTNALQLNNGSLRFAMPINGWLKIKVEGFPEIRRSLYLDYQPHRQLIQDLASGDWRNKLKDGHLYNSGEVPWEAFNYDKTVEVLSNVNWIIEVKLNNRDAHWDAFEALF